MSNYAHEHVTRISNAITAIAIHANTYDITETVSPRAPPPGAIALTAVTIRVIGLSATYMFYIGDTAASLYGNKHVG